MDMFMKNSELCGPGHVPKMGRLLLVVGFVFNVPPTAKVIWRQGHGLKSHPTAWWSRESNLQPLVYKASGISTTPLRLLKWVGKNPIYIVGGDWKLSLSCLWDYVKDTVVAALIHYTLSTDFWLTFLEWFGLVCCFTSQSTAMVMSRRSVHLTTLFLGKLEQAVKPVWYFMLILLLVNDNITSWMSQRKGEWP